MPTCFVFIYTTDKVIIHTTDKVIIYTTDEVIIYTTDKVINLKKCILQAWTISRSCYLNIPVFQSCALRKCENLLLFCNFIQSKIL